MRGLLYRVIVIPQELQSALYGALLVFAVQAELWLADLVSKYLGVTVDFTGGLAIWAAILAVLLTALAKKGLEAVVPEKYHAIVNSFLVWLGGFFAAGALLRAM